MSHIAEIDLELKDMRALAAAADALGMTLVQDAKTFSYYSGQKAPCIHKLVLKDAPAGAYEVGLVYTDATQTAVKPAIDTWGQHGARLVKALGEGCVELKKRYAAEVSANQMRKQGYRVQVKQDGLRYKVVGSK